MAKRKAGSVSSSTADGRLRRRVVGHALCVGGNAMKRGALAQGFSGGAFVLRTHPLILPTGRKKAWRGDYETPVLGGFLRRLK